VIANLIKIARFIVDSRAAVIVDVKSREFPCL